jgi:16S rRNA (uracil1498-N3)-methyltransferase
LVEKLTELGATTLVPLVTEHGVAQPSDAALERLRRAVIEASKQCGRNRLMTIHEPQRWHEWISASSLAGEPRCLEPLRLIAHPGGKPIDEYSSRFGSPVQLTIGPEGGFSELELAAATAAGWQSVDLGPRILRVETAAIALAAAVALC